MEVTTVSPSPASLTEGDDLCEIDVSTVAIHIVTLLICLCGLAGNGAVLWLLSQNGAVLWLFRLESPNSAIFHLAVADFLFLLFTVPSAFLFLVEDVSCSPIVSLTYVRFLFQLSVVSYFWGLYRLTRSSKAVNMYDLCKFCCSCILPICLVVVADSVQYWAFFALFAVIPTRTFLCPSHEQGQCRAALISMYIILLLFIAPMVISCTIDIIEARCGSKKQQHKRRDTVVFIVVLFTLLLGICNFLQQLGYMPVSIQVFFLLICIHSSTKPFIYFLAGKCWSPCSVGSIQLSLQRVFEEKVEKPPAAMMPTQTQ